MQAAPFQQGASWETISSLLGRRRVCGRGTKTIFPSVGLKGKYYLPTTAIISSSAVMTAGIDQKEKITPEVSHINAKQAVMGGRTRKGEGCGLMDTVLGDSVLCVGSLPDCTNVHNNQAVRALAPALLGGRQHREHFISFPNDFLCPVKCCFHIN